MDFPMNVRRSFLFLTVGMILNLIGLQSSAQSYNIQLKNGVLSPKPIQSFDGMVIQPNKVVDGHAYLVLQFYNIPDQPSLRLLADNSIELISYISGNAYYARVDVNKFLSASKSQLGVRFASVPDDMFKLHPTVFNEDFPEWSLDGKNIRLIATLFEKDLLDDVLAIFEEQKIYVHESSQISGKIILNINKEDIKRVSYLPHVRYLEPIDPPSHPENYGARSQHRSNVIHSGTKNGLNYDGSGITVGMHDDGIIGPHIDYEGRILQQFTNSNGGDHGDHVAGTIMGAGNLDPTSMGMAPGSMFYVYSSSNNNFDSAVSHLQNYDVVIVSKSYSNGCNNGYTSLTEQLDEQVHDNPSLIHIFSAGNNGTSNCGYGAGSGWGNVTGGHKIGKNVVAVANLTSADVVSNSSSRGPASDGRLKPDISAKGSSVVSTTDVNDYTTKSGTSMACPGVSGSFAQLYQAYEDLNAGATPPSGLIKAAVLNTAEDLGNPGPDFKYGWGRINNLRAYETLEKGTYLASQLSNGDTNTHLITVPANTVELRVMVLWVDEEGSTSAAKALVNNLDLRVENPSSTSFLPWVLDPTPNATALNSNAVRGVDTLNNMEQVTIDNPASGTYTIDILGTHVPMGPQDYHLVYYFVEDEFTLTYPNGGDPFVPGESEFIKWDAHSNTGTFTLEYSTNQGVGWNTISNNVGGSARQFSWTVPSGATGSVKVRLSRGGNSDESDHDFSIIGVPDNLNVDWACPDSIQLSWSPVAGATGYEASILGNMYMDSAGTSSDTSIILKNISPLENDWLSVKALGPNEAVGRRAIAIQKPLGTFGCQLNDDASVVSVVSPSNGSIADCHGVDDMTIKVNVKNQGINSISNVPISLQIDNQPVVTETFAGPLSPGDSAIFSFSNNNDFSQLGYYSLKVWTAVSADKNAFNDTTDALIEINSGTVVEMPWSENFENFLRCGTNNDCEGTRCNVNNGWHNDTNLVFDDIDWRTDDQGTRSNGTGPEFDHDPGTASGNFMFTEASESCNDKAAHLITPCLNLIQSVTPRFTYWYHMYGVEMGELHLDVFSDGTWIEDIVPPHVGDMGDVWLKDSIDLSAFSGELVNIRFRGVTGWGYRSDMAIDDINLFDTFEDTSATVNEINELDARFIPMPNPSNGNIRIFGKGMNGVFNYTVANTNGQEVAAGTWTFSGNDDTKILDLSSFEGGIYVLVISNNGFIQQNRLVIY